MPPAQTDSPEPYFEERMRGFTLDGREVRDRFYPSRMSAYGLAKSLCVGYVERRDIFEQRLAERFFSYIDETLKLKSLQDRKPTKEERKRYKAFAQAFKAVFQANVESLARSALRDNYVDAESYSRPGVCYEFNFGYVTVPLADSERQLNSAIFNRRVQNIINRLAESPGFRTVCEDFMLVQELKDDPERFGELERLCIPVLRRFVATHRTREFASNDLYQEGLLVVWRSAQSYEGRNFARFSTMVKAGLHNKFSNLMEYSMADKRRINRVAFRIGSGNPDDSYMAQKCDEAAFRAWDMEQREQRVNGHFDPFATAPLSDLFHLHPRVEYFGGGSDSESDCEIEAVSLETNEVVTDANFPHLNEYPVSTWGKKLEAE
ncbi:MAG: hypothetical protein HYW25_00820 [Candidatus Aenigmarchaeota archaeon]|nr:hypothetical protein [Candidatus Aenigmarchaeota archaeon]